MRSLFLLIIFTHLLAASQPKAMPRVLFDDSVAADFRALIQDNWWTFLTFFEARSDCIRDIRIVAVQELADRAIYDPPTLTTFVRVPERGSLLRAALIHEWAHHLEFQCPAQLEMRDAFLKAQNLPPTTPWLMPDGSRNLPAYRWASIPSEQFAETVVASVLERRNLRTPVTITEAGLRVIETWAKKKN